MSLEQGLKSVIGRLCSGLLENEAQVKQAAILPILRTLDWDDSDPESFKPEYSVGRGLVDYALLDHGNPLVFIEAKRIGALDAGGEEQLFGYASNRGVPLLVLTDGNRWDFYLSMAAGVPSERRFYRLELLLKHKIPEYVDFLDQHLRKGRVVSGDARLVAEKRHASNREQERAQQAIPRTWRALLQEPDEMLRDLVAEMVESECGTKPELDEVEVFLKNLVFTSPPPKSGSGSSVSSPDPDIPSFGPPQLARARIVGFSLGEEHVESGTAIGTLADLLTRFERDVPEFMERFAVKTISRNRNLVAKDPADLYKKSHLVDKHSKILTNGWWLGTNLSKAQVRGHIKTACGVAGVSFGSQLKLIER